MLELDHSAVASVESLTLCQANPLRDHIVRSFYQFFIRLLVRTILGCFSAATPHTTTSGPDTSYAGEAWWTDGAAVCPPPLQLRHKPLPAAQTLSGKLVPEPEHCFEASYIVSNQYLWFCSDVPIVIKLQRKALNPSVSWVVVAWMFIMNCWKIVTTKSFKYFCNGWTQFLHNWKRVGDVTKVNLYLGCCLTAELQSPWNEEPSAEW